ncbi:MAG: dynamin family protein [Cyanobacteria bacterium P01_F01_bin.150]
MDSQPNLALALASPQQDVMQALLTAVGVLDPSLDPGAAEVRQRIQLVSDRLQNSTLRVTVFAPFNYGKSTLLNALLGHKALPIDLIPTTGAAIRVVYGDTLTTTIRLNDGTVTQENGTDILKQFAVLDDQRQMRGDVKSVTVTCAHPLLKAGLEFVDLPGTDDQEAQDALVREYLLTADVVVQVLDGRRLMTLMEREQLRDWLLDRGIDQVIFVVNFLNLLEPDDQQEVTRRLRFVAESFRANLPPTISNLYRVDALPALRARLKGDGATVQTTGLPTFETALQTLAHYMQQHPHQVIENRFPRVLKLVPQVQRSLQAHIQVLDTVVKQATVERDRQKLDILHKAQTLIKKGFRDSVDEARQWLSPIAFLEEYQVEAADALQRLEFDSWVRLALEPVWAQYQANIVAWVYKACDFFDCPRPVTLSLSWPPTPDATLPDIFPNDSSSGSFSSDVADTLTKGKVPTMVAGGLGFLMGGPVGAALLGGTSYVLEKLDGGPDFNSGSSSSGWTAEQISTWYLASVQAYLRQTSVAGLKALDEYVTAANPMIHFPLPEAPTDDALDVSNQNPQVHQLKLLRSCSDQLTQTLEAIKLA